MFEAYSTDDLSLGTVLKETGTPTAWNPLVSGYDRPLYPHIMTLCLLCRQRW